MMDLHTSEQKRNGALWGLYIGDALAMPVHWYYNRSALFDDYG
jgi:ADP-ribosylglycohydrolase